MWFILYHITYNIHIPHIQRVRLRKKRDREHKVREVPPSPVVFGTLIMEGWMILFTVQILIHHLEISTLGFRVLNTSHCIFLILLFCAFCSFSWGRIQSEKGSSFICLNVHRLNFMLTI